MRNNMDYKEQAIQDGLDIQEMVRQPGWAKLKARIKAEQETLLMELRRIELEGRSLENVGADYIARIQRINGLDRVLEMVEEALEEYEQTIKNQ